MSDFKVASQVYLNQKLWERNCTPKEELQLTEIQLHPGVPSESRARKKPEAVHLFYILIRRWEDLRGPFDSFFSTAAYLLRFPEQCRFL